MSESDPPFSVRIDLGLVPERGMDLLVSSSEAERKAISAWLEIEGVESLKAKVLITRNAENDYSYAATFEADVVQACVVTLEPIPAHVSGESHRHFRVRPRASARRRKAPELPKDVIFSVADEDEPELLDSSIVDVAAPLLEDLSLALDPYPRAPGIVFEPPPEETGPTDNPFAVLERLKMAESGQSGHAYPPIPPGPIPPAKKRR